MTHPLAPRALALVAAGGAVGGLARDAIGRAAPTAPDAFPVTTLLVNVGGAFLLGVLLGVLARRGTPEHPLRLLLGVGVLGAFTTFSTLAVEIVRLGQAGRPGLGLAAAAASVAVGLVAVGVGHRLGRAVGGAGPRPPFGTPAS